MDVFEFRQKLVTDYSAFTRSFTRVRSDDVKNFIDSAYDSQRYWPAPLVQVNPNFRLGHTVDELVKAGKPGVQAASSDRHAAGGCKTPARWAAEVLF